jgi:hypothetical protein
MKVFHNELTLVLSIELFLLSVGRLQGVKVLRPLDLPLGRTPEMVSDPVLKDPQQPIQKAIGVAQCS